MTVTSVCIVSCTVKTFLVHGCTTSPDMITFGRNVCATRRNTRLYSGHFILLMVNLVVSWLVVKLAF